MTPAADRIVLGGTFVDLRGSDEAVACIRSRASIRGALPLAVCSVNLDHIHHFGQGGRWSGVLDAVGEPDSAGRSIEWLNLIDGAPLAAQASRITGRRWPRLAGSDLIGPILAGAEQDGTTVGFVGGQESTHVLLRQQLALRYPDLLVSGFWAPTREDLGDSVRARDLAMAVADSGTDLVVVGLGKPRQELWIVEHGAATGAGVLLAFGAVLDFLAGRIERAPGWVSRHGIEWAWRLAMEPRRMAKRYLVEEPPAYLTVRRTRDPAIMSPAVAQDQPAARFVGPAGHADVVVIIVSYNSAQHIGALLASLRALCRQLRLRVVVADNGSTDGTQDLLAAEDDIIMVEPGGNRGYAGGINAAYRHAGDADAVLVLNPDLIVEPGSLQAMRRRLRESDAGAVVPRLLDQDGSTYPSLRREPTVLRTTGDALFGSRRPGRPEWLSEIDRDPESYQHAHQVDWATGAAVLIRRDVADAVGEWDEQFFLYSEETDYLRRVRESGATVWYEPMARVQHVRGGSGSSIDLDALLAVNRVRYARKHRSAAYAAAIRGAVILHEVLRFSQPQHRAILRIVAWRGSWKRLPHNVRSGGWSADQPIGSIIIPAHDEEKVIGRTLRALAPLTGPPPAARAEIIVVCNGCTDGTARIARGFPGVRVIEIDLASKAAALNTGDAVAGAWPRLYLDADIEVDAEVVNAVFEVLAAGELLAVRPAFRYDTSGASPLVKAYYRARERMPSMHGALWGAGAYAVGAAGHERFGVFPPLTADDLFVDALFSSDEKLVLPTSPVRVRTPRTVGDLLNVVVRQHRGVVESDLPSTTGNTLRELLTSVRGPGSAADAAVYAALTVAGRLRGAGPGNRGAAWERDQSSRGETSAGREGTP
jgi:bacterial polymer biosynthesis proteins, WecB/TagA/CpsF family